MWSGQYRSGFYYTGNFGGNNDVGTAGSGGETGDFYTMQLIIAGASSIGVTKLALLGANTTSGTLKYRLGIYEADNDALPGTLLIDAGTVTKGTSSTVPQDSTSSAFTEVTLTAGKLYYLAALLEATAVANFFMACDGDAGWRTLPHVAEGVLTTDTGDYQHRTSNSSLPVIEGISTGSMPASGSITTYPQWDEASPKEAPLILMFVNTVTA